jgi:VanZ family protein
LSSVPSGQKSRAKAERPAITRDPLKLFRLGAAVIWTVVILLLCWIPATVVQKIEGGSPWFRVPELDKVIHAGIFAVLAILWRRAYSSRRAIGAIILGGFALGALTELGQLLPIVRRHAELYDLATDCVGVLVGVAIAPLIEPLLRAIERVLIRTPTPAAAAAVEE